MRRSIHAGRVVVDVGLLLLSVPILVLHELAHYAACVPFGGPDGVYLIRDTSRPGIRARLPVGAAIYHKGMSRIGHVASGLAPLVYLVALFPVRHSITSSFAAMAVAIVFGAGFVGLFDAVNVFFPGLYEEMMDPDGSHEFVLLIDLTPWTGREAPEQRMVR